MPFFLGSTFLYHGRAREDATWRPQSLGLLDVCPYLKLCARGGKSPVSASVKFLHRNGEEINQCALTEDNGKGLMAETGQTYIGMVVRNHLGSVALSAGRQISNWNGAEDAEAEALKFGLQLLAERFQGEVITNLTHKHCWNLDHVLDTSFIFTKLENSYFTVWSPVCVQDYEERPLQFLNCLT